MIHTDQHRMSPKHYALDPGSLELDKDAVAGHHYVAIHAVWFKRRNGLLAACLGFLSGYLDREPATVQEAARRLTDGRYGAHCWARLDASGYWSDGGATPKKIEADLAILRPMLDTPCQAPGGYVGWWHF